MPTLADRQRDFVAAIAADEVPAGLSTRHRSEIARRFGVYRNNVVTGLTDALRTRFPVVARLVGDDFFAAMARCFITAHPPRSPMMLAYGGEFPAFIAAFPPAMELAYLADVAALEVALGEAYHAADAASAGHDALARCVGVDPGNLRLRLQPSLRLVASSHPIVTIWRMNQPQAEPVPLDTWQPETAVVARPELAVGFRAAQPGEERFLRALLAGHSFAAAADDAWHVHAEFDPAATLARLIAEGLVTDLLATDPNCLPRTDLPRTDLPRTDLPLTDFPAPSIASHEQDAAP